MGECLITRRGGEPYKLPTLDENYPEDLTVVDGTSATFSVVFAEHGKPAQYTYKWYVNGEEVPGVTTAIYTRDTSSDKGEYNVYCEVTNRAGTVVSRVATLTVYTLPVLNSSYPADSTVDVGGSATLNVSISTDGYPASYTYQWYVNGSAVSGATGISYEHSNIGKESFSVYCVVTNAAGSVQSRAATLKGNRLYIWNNGDISGVTGGWNPVIYNAVDSSGASFSGGVITVNSGSVAYYALTKSKIDMTNYSTLYFVVSTPDGMAPGSNANVGVNKGVLNDQYNLPYNQYVASTGTSATNWSGFNGTKAVNISGISGSYNVSLHTYACVLKCTQIYME